MGVSGTFTYRRSVGTDAVCAAVEVNSVGAVAFVNEVEVDKDKIAIGESHIYDAPSN